MIALLCTMEPSRIPWLPQFVQHYRGIGVERFLLTLQLELLQVGEWIVRCDSDEFQVYPAPLAEVIRQCDAMGVNRVRGVLIDRVAEDFGLPAFDERTPIWQTYPRTCNVTIALAQGDPRKVVLARAPVLVKGDKHTLSKPTNPKTFTGWVRVHHFKWDAGVIDRLRYRIRPEWQASYPWWVESQRLLDYFLANDPRFRPSDLATVTLNGAHFVAFG